MKWIKAFFGLGDREPVAAKGGAASKVSSYVEQLKRDLAKQESMAEIFRRNYGEASSMTQERRRHVKTVRRMLASALTA